MFTSYFKLLFKNCYLLNFYSIIYYMIIKNNQAFLNDFYAQEIQNYEQLMLTNILKSNKQLTEDLNLKRTKKQ